MFLIFNAVTTFSPYHYFSMVLSDLAEEDYVNNEVYIVGNAHGSNGKRENGQIYCQRCFLE